MKKAFILTIVLFFAMSCEIGFQKTKAIDNSRYGKYVFTVACENYDIQYNTIEIGGMEYAIFGGATSSTYGGVSVAVVNLTKDKLEVELLKKQLSKK